MGRCGDAGTRGHGGRGDGVISRWWTVSAPPAYCLVHAALRVLGLIELLFRTRVPASPHPRVPASPHLPISPSPRHRVTPSSRYRVSQSPCLPISPSPRLSIPASPCPRVPVSAHRGLRRQPPAFCLVPPAPCSCLLAIGRCPTNRFPVSISFPFAITNTCHRPASMGCSNSV